MARNARYTVKFRRQLLGRTNYHRRRRILSSGATRFVIRRSNRNIVAQLIKFTQTHDEVIAAASTKELQKHGWKGSRNNTSAAYLLGVLVGIKAKKAGITKAIADIGLHTSHKGGVLFAVIKGAIDVGIQIPVSETVLPSEQRIKGEHIAAFAKTLKDDDIKYKKQFGDYVKKNIDPEHLPQMVENVKNLITGASQ